MLRGTVRFIFGRHEKALFSKITPNSYKKLCQDPKHIGGDRPGFFRVLHTWGRQLQYHPHIHYVVPGGAFSSADGSWQQSDERFFPPVHALSPTFRAKFRDRMVKARLLAEIPKEVWTKSWNVNSQAVGSSEASIKYLAPYVFRVAISNHRIVKVENGKVTFTYTKVGGARSCCMELDAMEFIRRFLQHVLPTGFTKVRYYGFLSPNSSVALDEARGRIELAYGFDVTEPEREGGQTEGRVHLRQVRQPGEISLFSSAGETVGAGTVRVKSENRTGACREDPRQYPACGPG